MVNFTHENVDDLINNFDYPKPLQRNPNVYGLLGVIGEETNRLDLDNEQLYDQRFLKTATGSELEKLAEEVGITRRDGETDEHLRKRIYAEYVALRSDTTYDQFATAVMDITDANENEFTIATPPNTDYKKVVEVELQQNVLEESILTQDEIVSFLNRALSVDARAIILVEGTFGFSGDPDNEGFGEGTWTSSIN